MSDLLPPPPAPHAHESAMQFLADQAPKAAKRAAAGVSEAAEAEGAPAEGSGASSALPVPEISCSSAAAASSVHAEA